MITESDADPQHVSTKDSIIGRTSYPVLAKVRKTPGEFILNVVELRQTTNNNNDSKNMTRIKFMSETAS